MFETANIQLFTRILDGADFVSDLSGIARGWRRTIRRNGGYWQGTFRVMGSETELISFFNTWLGYHVEEKAGGAKTWEGMVYEMDLTVGGVTRRRSLDLLYNHVVVDYTDTSGSPASTAAASNAQSIAVYGRREARPSLQNVSAGAAEARRDVYLKEYGWPYARTVGVNLKRGGEAVLNVTVCGYVFTLNWRHESVGDGSTDDLDDWIAEIAANDLEFVASSQITANTLQVKKDTDSPTRCWSLLMDLTGAGDASGNIYRMWLDNDRRLCYDVIITTPMYFLRGGELYTSPGAKMATNPWVVKPGVVRDFSFQGGNVLSGWLESNKDFYLDEVECGDGGLVLRTEHFDEAEILAAQENYQRELMGGGWEVG